MKNLFSFLRKKPIVNSTSDSATQTEALDNIHTDNNDPLRALQVTLLNLLTLDPDFVETMYPAKYSVQGLTDAARALAALIVDFPGAPLSRSVFELLYPDFNVDSCVQELELDKKVHNWRELQPSDQVTITMQHFVRQNLV